MLLTIRLSNQFKFHTKLVDDTCWRSIARLNPLSQNFDLWEAIEVTQCVGEGFRGTCSNYVAFKFKFDFDSPKLSILFETFSGIDGANQVFVTWVSPLKSVDVTTIYDISMGIYSFFS